MENWKVILGGLDDDYLVGMANKGIVKRAYKDMEAGDYKVLSTEAEAQLAVGGETVVLRQPLGESSCSCPSRTICRHVVLGILALKKFVAEAEGGETTGEEGAESAGTQENLPAGAEGVGTTGREGAESAGTQENLPAGAEAVGTTGREGAQSAGTQENLPNGAKAGGTTGQEGAESAGTQENSPDGAKTAGKNTVDGDAKREESAKTDTAKLKSRLLAEISAFPFPSLKKTLGAKQLLAVVSQKKSGQLPEITYSSIITVRLPKGGYTVKLLSPLEYSSCTCHKKEFCAHKAAAVLWCKLMAGEVSEEEIAGAEELQDFAMGDVKDAAAQIQGFLTELLDTGLARTSPDVLDYLDRLALISHNAKLANFEGYLRALHDSYGNYLKRKASFQEGLLIHQFARLYKRVGLLMQAADAADVVGVAAQAGEFRSEYAPVGNLSLAGIAMEHFESQTGYEGETVYFLEENTKEWYTYTSARPVFYETTGRRGRKEMAAAPWELPVSIKEMVGLRLRLSGARCDMRGRLSSSADTKGEVAGSCRKENCLRTGELGGWYYRDFGKLFEEQVGGRHTLWLKTPQSERREGDLVFLRPYSFTRGEFSQTEQKLEMWLYDRAGREVLLELKYSKREEWGIGYLERLTEDKEPCFLGKLYFKDGRMRLYPVTVFEKGELVEDFGWEETGGNGNERQKEKNANRNAAQEKEDADRNAAQKEKDVDGNMEQEKENADQNTAQGKEDADRNAAQAKDDADGNMAQAEKNAEERQETIDALSWVLEDADSLLGELYQSGLDTVHESTLQGLARAGKLAGQYGLLGLSKMLAQLADGAAMRRHRMGKEADGLAGVYARACEYLYLCREKVEVDRGWGYYGAVAEK